jgi:hypothetical protein
MTTSIILEIRRTLSELELCSHMPAAELGYSSKSAAHPGGKRPPGGVDYREDKHNLGPQTKTDAKPRILRSAEHYRRRLAKAHNDRTLEIILEQANDSLNAWRRQPPPTKQNEPKKEDPGWKRYVAESELMSESLAAKYGVSSQYIREVRKKYREAV